MAKYIITCRDEEGENVPLPLFNKETMQLETATFMTFEEARETIATELKEQDDYYRRGLIQPSEMNDAGDYNITLLQ